MMQDDSGLMIPPHSVEAEQAVLGGLLRNNGAVDRTEDLREEHFYRHDHRVIFACIYRLISASKAADVITVFEALGAKAEEVGGLPYLNALSQGMPTAANIRHHALIVRDRALKRGIISSFDEVIAAAYVSSLDGVDLVDQAMVKLEALSKSGNVGEPENAAVGLTDFVERIEAKIDGTSTSTVSTGIPDLDKKLGGGPSRGDLVVLAGRPKMGKSSLALQIADNVAVDGVAAFLSMEMSKQQLSDRRVASIGKIDLGKFKDPSQLQDHDWANITRAIQKMNEMSLYWDTQGGLSLMQVRNKAYQIKRKAGGRLDLLAIDYLQLMSGHGDTRNNQIEAITRGLKSLAKELDCVVLLLSQLNRNLEQRTNKRPLPSDLRDSGSIEQDCDTAIFVYRDEVYNEQTTDKGIAEAIVALNRQGETGTVYLTYQGQYTRFEQVAHGWHPAPPKTAPSPARGFSD